MHKIFVKIQSKENKCLNEKAILYAFVVFKDIFTPCDKSACGRAGGVSTLKLVSHEPQGKNHSDRPIDLVFD